MEEFFRSGLVADVILAVMIAEASLLLVYRKLTGRGLAAADLVAMLLAGACLVLALRAALTGAQWPVVAAVSGRSAARASAGFVPPMARQGGHVTGNATCLCDAVARAPGMEILDMLDNLIP